MPKINTKKYRDLFRKTTGIEDDIVSTIDHVFGSPPLRIIDSHQRLMEMGNSTILLWDITQPNIHKYRADLVLDFGLYTSKNSNFYLYSSKDFYHKGKLLTPNFTAQLSLLDQVLNGEFLGLDNKQKRVYKQRASHLINVYVDNLKKHSKVTQFYKSLLIDLYKLLGLNDLAAYITEKMIPLSESGIINKFLPKMIVESKNEPFGFSNMIANTDYLNRPYFRNISSEKLGFDVNDKKQILKNLNNVIDLLKSGDLLPKNQMYFWAWSLCGINHFGNDYGILENLEYVFKSIDISCKTSVLQLTRPKEDGLNFIQFKNIHSYSLGNPKSGSTKFNLLSTKSSRVTNICTVYLHSGKEGFQKYWMEYQKTGKAIELDMLSVSL